MLSSLSFPRSALHSSFAHGLPFGDVGENSELIFQSLAWLFRHAAEEVRSTHLDDASSTSTIDSAEVVENGLAPSDPDWTGVSPLGSGSDYTAFLQRYGVSRPTHISPFSHVDMYQVW